MTPARQAETAGFDLSLVEESLRLTPEQRLLQHQAALDLLLEVERVGADCVSELQNLLQRPSDAGIEFVVVGGVAAVLHGSSMVTRNLDVCAELNSQNLQKLRDAFRELHPVHLGALDLLGSITGVGDFERVMASAVEVELFGRSVKVIAIDELIKAKEAVGRQKDLLAATELRAIASRNRW